MRRRCGWLPASSIAWATGKVSRSSERSCATASHSRLKRGLSIRDSSMSDATQPAAPPHTAGSLLRAARQAQGLHIAALAATIKVSHRKLEFLEADRLDEL